MAQRLTMAAADRRWGVFSGQQWFQQEAVMAQRLTVAAAADGEGSSRRGRWRQVRPGVGGSSQLTMSAESKTR